MPRLAGLFIVLGLLTGCQTLSQRSVSENPVPGAPSNPPAELPPSTTKAIDSEKTTDDRIVDFNDLPKQYQDLVMQWVGYFQGRGRHHMDRYLSRSTRYIGMMKSILREAELPEDLVYIALIESGFNHKAHSRAGAVGYWQFIRATGRSYGLRNDRFIDERRDPVESTKAAAQYFKGLYNLFGSWPLAIAAYNVGENRIKRVVMKKYTRDLWELISLRQLPAETSNYVPKFIAAEMIAREPKRFGFTDVDYEPPLTFDTVKSSRPVDLRSLAAHMGLDFEDMKRLNPKYKTAIAPLESGSLELRIPKGAQDRAVAALEKSYASDKSVRVAGRETSAPSNRYYKVKRGDTLQSIASRFKVSVEEIARSAKLSRGGVVKVGSFIRLPSEEAPVRTKSSSRSVASSNGQKVHVVRRGDTLIGIAKQYDIPIVRLVDENRLTKRSMLAVGRRLVIPD